MTAVQLAHGGGGQLSQELICEVILPALGIDADAPLTDSAVLDVPAGAMAMTTDSYVVQPLEFPGGDIGTLAVCGTVNDLAVCGAVPAALSLSLVIQEGLEMALLERLMASVGRTARQCGVKVVTGDTKVVQHWACDGLIVNTTGVGPVLPAARLGFARIEGGDVVLLSGPLGEHGLAVMLAREALSISAELKSDCQPLHELARALVEALGEDLKFMRDPTRSGLAATLAEMSAGAGRDIVVHEADIPVNPTCRAAGEMLGLDLLNVANEGKLVAVVAARAAHAALDVMRASPAAPMAARIGEIGEAKDAPLVELVTAIGGRRVVQMPYGRELPRIC